jgi:cyclopropane fatty-acyl-phospholipid synthase-like methyltransferase
LLPAGASVLDLGCGAGVPVARDLAVDFSMTGVDVSAVQIDRARRLVPTATFVQADMVTVEFQPQSFDAVVCLYALIHVPVCEHRSMLERIGPWLKPGGVLLATVGHTAGTATEHNWLGVPGATMYWSHADWLTYRQWLVELSYTIVDDDFVPEDDGGHHFVLAHR